LKVILLAMVVGVVATACNSASEADAVAKKIEQGAALSQSDYTVIIDYMGKFAEKAQPIQDNINNLPADDPKAQPFIEQFDKLKESYPLLDQFKSVLDKASAEQVGTENVNLVDKYAGYEWFTSPSWATINTDPGIGGIEMESPSNDSNGVVAGAVDEEKIEMK
ncbi:MAG: hypothetical protein K2J15_03460, partial [Muribaculaceae bacterium]|nr:hypothetical protein [Muribaculaceae bacterium]